MFLVELTQQAIDVQRLLRAVSHPDAGGEVLFLGTTRRFTAAGSACRCSVVESVADSDANYDAVHQLAKLSVSSELAPKPNSVGSITEYLVYEAHETMALKQMNQLARQAAERWPLKAVAIVHRLGKVCPEEASIAIAVCSPHRSEAYEASRWLIDSIKHDVPIWKQEHFADSSSSWVHPDWTQSDECSGTKR
ncbi:MAG: molybdenum cofactor biosynthesis protein MoaE [Pirellulales bacterium]